MLNETFDCTKIIPLIDAFHDGELSEHDKDKVANHFQACPPCKARLRETETLVNSLRALPRLQMERDLQIDWDSVVQEKKQRQSTFADRISLIRNKRLFVAAAALFVMLIAAGLIIHSSQPSATLMVADKSITDVNIIAGHPTSGKHVIQSLAPTDAPESKRQQAMNRQNGDPTNGTLLTLFSSDPSPINEQLGISTDEDGLYALKL